MAQNRERMNLGEYAEEATIIQDKPTAKPSVKFLEANTDAITMDCLLYTSPSPLWMHLQTNVSFQLGLTKN